MSGVADQKDTVVAVRKLVRDGLANSPRIDLQDLDIDCMVSDQLSHKVNNLGTLDSEPVERVCATGSKSDHDPFVPRPHYSQMGDDSREVLAFGLSQPVNAGLFLLRQELTKVCADQDVTRSGSSRGGREIEA